MKNTPFWQPNYTITPATASGLMEIEAARAVVAQVPLPVAVQAGLRRRARVHSTHHPTRIKGNRLTLQEAQEVIDERRTMFSGRNGMSLITRHRILKEQAAVRPGPCRINIAAMPRNERCDMADHPYSNLRL